MHTDLIILDLMTARIERLRDATPETRDEHGWTPLHAAVAFNGRGRVVAVLDKDPQLLDMRSNDGWTPLHVAAALNGNPRAIALLPGDANVSEPAVVDCLLERGADRNAVNKDGWTPLHVAAALNHNARVAEKLLRCSGGPSPGVKDRRGRTPLHMAAAMNGSPRVMKILLKCPGANQNARNKAGCTPLHRAAQKTRNPGIVKVLLDGGADPRLKDEKGRLPVDLAEENKKLRGTEVYWQLHAAKYLAQKNWDGIVSTGDQHGAGAGEVS